MVMLLGWYVFCAESWLARLVFVLLYVHECLRIPSILHQPMYEPTKVAGVANDVMNGLAVAPDTASLSCVVHLSNVKCNGDLHAHHGLSNLIRFQ